ncbi:hypothetical protein NFI96_012226 [Prochilodus magdalenae]|nr:hypothetical protein NFI96_012226 [Prochilodus magdalenae]
MCYLTIFFKTHFFMVSEMIDLEQTFLHTAITEVLPDLSEVTKDILEETLQSTGVETYDDFQFIEEGDLLSVLRPIQARKVLAAWKLRWRSCYSAGRFMLSVDQNIVQDNIPSFISALCMMFGSYYCFDIHYPSELANNFAHLFFFYFSRCFFSINPKKGTKVEKTSRLPVNHRGVTLIQELSDHEWHDV